MAFLFVFGKSHSFLMLSIKSSIFTGVVESSNSLDSDLMGGSWGYLCGRVVGFRDVSFIGVATCGLCRLLFYLCFSCRFSFWLVEYFANAIILIRFLCIYALFCDLGCRFFCIICLFVYRSRALMVAFSVCLEKTSCLRFYLVSWKATYLKLFISVFVLVLLLFSLLFSLQFCSSSFFFPLFLFLNLDSKSAVSLSFTHDAS
jgi:hypothetical protein